MIIGKKDKQFVEGLKEDIFELTNDVNYLHSLNDTLIKNYVKILNKYDSVVSINNLLNLSGLTVMEVSNISGINLEEFLDSDVEVTPELYNSVLRALFKFFLENTEGNQ